MPAEILINVRPNETRVAYIDNGTLNDLKIERKTSPTLVGSIHRGKVIRVLPGMQAAFVDIGLDRAAFLYVGDVRGGMDNENGDLFEDARTTASGLDEPLRESLLDPLKQRTVHRDSHREIQRGSRRDNPRDNDRVNANDNRRNNARGAKLESSLEDDDGTIGADLRVEHSDELHSEIRDEITDQIVDGVKSTDTLSGTSSESDGGGEKLNSPRETPKASLGFPPSHHDSRSENRPRIQELLTEGQTILVQVAKDPLGSKGARITTHISLPGRNVVFMPTLSHLGVSRRIEDPDERERLRKIITKIEVRGGLIVRTAGEGASEAGLQADVEYLHRLWQEVQKNYDRRSKPGLVHAEPDVELRALRDLLSEDVDKVITDNEDSFKKICAFINQFMPKFKNKVSLYSDSKPLFDIYEIDLEISRSMERKIWLKSGGYIVIDEAEALVVIDVNTGRYVGKKDFEDTIFKTNLEALREIAHQLRIRNCGGIIIIDFIDMEKDAHREKVLQSLREELQKDRARTTVVSMSNLGLVEMTRKRIRPSLVKTLCEPCTYCDGRGYIKQKATIAHEIFRDLEREGKSSNKNATTVVHCHASIGDFIYEEETENLEDVERRIGRNIVFKLEPGFHREQYEIFTL